MKLYKNIIILGVLVCFFVVPNYAQNDSSLIYNLLSKKVLTKTKWLNDVSFADSMPQCDDNGAFLTASWMNHLSIRTTLDTNEIVVNSITEIVDDEKYCHFGYFISFQLLGLDECFFLRNGGELEFFTIYGDKVWIKSDSITRVILEKYNVFTPDGDRKNDWFELELDEYELISAIIYDRNGEIVFEGGGSNIYSYTNKSNNASVYRVWNGFDQNLGLASPKGKYYYILKLKHNDFEDLEMRNGTITLIR